MDSKAIDEYKNKGKEFYEQAREFVKTKEGRMVAIGVAALATALLVRTFTKRGKNKEKRS